MAPSARSAQVALRRLGGHCRRWPCRWPCRWRRREHRPDALGAQTRIQRARSVRVGACRERGGVQKGISTVGLDTPLGYCTHPEVERRGGAPEQIQPLDEDGGEALPSLRLPLRLEARGAPQRLERGPGSGAGARCEGASGGGGELCAVGDQRACQWRIARRVSEVR